MFTWQFPLGNSFHLKEYLVIGLMVCNSSLDIIHKRINQAITFSHLLPSFWAGRAHVSVQERICWGEDI